MHQELLAETVERMEKSVTALMRELSKIRSGRASLSILDDIRVDSYGTQMPLNQVATLTIPESRMIVIQPWDMQLLKVVEKAILKSNIGLTPLNDGKVIRISIPQLTEERRKDLVKQTKKICEEYRVAVRNCRRDAIDSLKKMKKNKEVSEDITFKMQDEIQDKTDQFIKKIDRTLSEKEKELMAV